MPVQDRLTEIENLAEKIFLRIVSKQDDQKADKELMAWRAFGYAGMFITIRDTVREGKHETAVKFHKAYLE